MASDEQWTQDLERGTEYEGFVRSIAEQAGCTVLGTSAERTDYHPDGTITLGRQDADLVLLAGSGGGKAVEVKTSYTAQVYDSFLVEVTGNDGGVGSLDASKADVWIFVAPQLKRMWSIGTPELRRLVRERHLREVYRCGDANGTCVALPIPVLEAHARRVYSIP